MLRLIGGVIFWIGASFIIMEVTDYTPDVLRALAAWGDKVGWGIKITVMIIGACIWFLARQFEGPHD